MRFLPFLLLLLGLALHADATHATTPASCPGDPITPTQVIEGTFPSSVDGADVMLPFDVPSGTTQVRVKCCWGTPESGSASHTVDLGLWDARPKDKTWGPKQFRGWGGSSHPDVT